MLIFHKANNSCVILLMVSLIIGSEFSNNPRSQSEQWEKKNSNRSSREEDDRQGKRITERTNTDVKMRIILPVSECRFVKSFTSQISAEGSLIPLLVSLL